MANFFFNDTSCVAVYNFESGALATDSKGSNTITNLSGLTSNTSDYKQGAGCSEGAKTVYAAATINTSNESANFPFKYGTENKTITFCFWFKLLESGGDDQVLLGDSSLYAKLTSNTFHIDQYNWNGSTLNYQSSSNTPTLSTGRWYHITVAYSDVPATIFGVSNRKYGIRIWDDTSQNYLSDTTGTFTYGVYLQNNGYTALYNGTFHILVDEHVIFNRVLSIDEITAIKNGTYAKNNFTTDSSCVAVYNFESGAIRADSKNGNSFYESSDGGANTSDKKQGSSSVSLRSSWNDGLWHSFPKFSSDFPFKNNSENKIITTSFWLKDTGSGNSGSFHLSITDSFSLQYQGTSTGWRFVNYYSGGSDNIDLLSSATLNRWYHVSFILCSSPTTIFGQASRNWGCRIWDDTSQSYVYDTTGTTPHPTEVSTGSGGGFSVGDVNNNDFLCDEVVIFNRVLSSNELTAIKDGKYAKNNFVNDVSCVAVYNFESDALANDSKNNNNFTTYQISADTSDFKQGSSSGYLDDYTGYAICSDSSLSSNFPFKDTTENKIISSSFWIKDLGTFGIEYFLIGKTNSFQIFGATTGWTISSYNGNDFDASNIFASPNSNRWYHVSLVIASSATTIFEQSNKNWGVKVWDDTSQSYVYDSTGTFANPTVVSSGDFFINVMYNNYLIDEMVVFNRVLSSTDFISIKNGTYNVYTGIGYVFAPFPVGVARIIN